MLKRASSMSTVAPTSKRGRLTHSSPRVPQRMASAEAAARAQADPPLSRLVRALQDVADDGADTACGKAVVYWMRMGDLRVVDNRALTAASARAVADDVPLLVLFVLSPGDCVAHDTGRRRVDFTLRNLAQIKHILAEVHIPLWAVTHAPRRTVPERVVELVQDVGAAQLYANMEYGVDELRRDARVCALAKERGMRAQFVHDRSLVEPGVVCTKDGRAYTVYSPFQRRWIAVLNEQVAVRLEESPGPRGNASRVREDPVFGPLFSAEVPSFIEGFELGAEEAETMARLWPAGTEAAQEILSRFLHTESRASQLGLADPLAGGAKYSDKNSRIAEYGEARDRGDRDTTSRLSPYLAAGVLSARECVRATMMLLGRNKVEAGRATGVGRWVQELAWRDFYTDLLAHHPRLSMGRPFQEKMADVKWETNEAHLQAWKDGKTGVPIVDAAMRQLNTMGWVHNRMRMIAAMFLAKDLMLDWRLGERYFMEQLVDGDLASNNGGWQWCASTGADPAPYFRIFNPYIQSSKADPTGEYIRTFVPELGGLHGREIHDPPVELADRLGYPRAIVVHAEVRERAVRRYRNPGVI